MIDFPGKPAAVTTNAALTNALKDMGASSLSADAEMVDLEVLERQKIAADKYQMLLRVSSRASSLATKPPVTGTAITEITPQTLQQLRAGHSVLVSSQSSIELPTLTRMIANLSLSKGIQLQSAGKLPLTPGLANAMQRLVPEQQGMTRLLANLLAAQQSPATAKGLSTEVRGAINDLLRLLIGPQQLQSGTGVKNAIQQSGLLRENHLVQQLKTLALTKQGSINPGSSKPAASNPTQTTLASASSAPANVSSSKQAPAQASATQQVAPQQNATKQAPSGLPARLLNALGWSPAKNPSPPQAPNLSSKLPATSLPQGNPLAGSEPKVTTQGKATSSVPGGEPGVKDFKQALQQLRQALEQPAKALEPQGKAVPEANTRGAPLPLLEPQKNATKPLSTTYPATPSPTSVTSTKGAEKPLQAAGQFQQQLLPPLPGFVQIQPQARTRPVEVSKDWADGLSAILLKQVKGVLARVTLHQLASTARNQESGQPATQLNFEIPVIQNNQLSVFQFQIEEEKPEQQSEQKEQQRSWVVQIGFDLEDLGPMVCQIRLAGVNTSITFWAEWKQTQERTQSLFSTLEKNLQSLGLTVNKLQSRHGLPEMDKTLLQQQLVDVTT